MIEHFSDADGAHRLAERAQGISRERCGIAQGRNSPGRTSGKARSEIFF
jgi:hypothetical protein